MILSTGMATVAELDETVRAARAAGCRDLVPLKCTSTYPATPENTNMQTISPLQHPERWSGSIRNSEPDGVVLLNPGKPLKQEPQTTPQTA